MDDAPEYLILPGYGGSGPAHWQSLWESGDPAFRRVQQRDWERPDRGEWEKRLAAAVAESARPKVLVAHSLACLLVVHWAGGAPAEARSRVKGALLVAPVDPQSPAFPPEARSFGPVPRAALPFASLVVASSDDPYGTLDFGRLCARAWGSRLVEVGAKGHINAASGLGSWEDGKRLLASLAES